ncbi:MAG TPA: hypothetical protein VF746_22765 [Longimicrobium sp.]|jgi:uncharacterized membrane protein HdeD (DUF308 family)
MLEEIHTAQEDQRKTRTIVALALVGLGVYALADAALTHWSGVSTVGLGLGAAGAAMLAWLRGRSLPRHA